MHWRAVNFNDHQPALVHQQWSESKSLTSAVMGDFNVTQEEALGAYNDHSQEPSLRHHEPHDILDYLDKHPSHHIYDTSSQ